MKPERTKRLNRFKQTARKLGADESTDALDQIFERLMLMKHGKKAVKKSSRLS